MASRFEPSGVNEFATTFAGLVPSGENERVWRDLVNALPAAVYITDAAGRIIFYNEAAATCGAAAPSLARVSSAARGSSIGLTARHYDTTNVRWR